MGPPIGFLLVVCLVVGSGVLGPSKLDLCEFDNCSVTFFSLMFFPRHDHVPQLVPHAPQLHPGIAPAPAFFLFTPAMVGLFLSLSVLSFIYFFSLSLSLSCRPGCACWHRRERERERMMWPIRWCPPITMMIVRFSLGQSIGQRPGFSVLSFQCSPPLPQTLKVRA